MTKREFLAMSLPYRLKCLYIGSDGFYKSDTLKDDYSYETNLHGIIGYCYYFKEDFNDIELIEEDKFKPILRPLSDLTKTINHNGDEFVPMIRLAKIGIGDYNFRIGTTVGGDKYVYYVDGDFVFSNNQFTNRLYTKGGNSTTYKSAPQFELLLKLIEWHFDMDGFIEKGEAIDANILDINPYK